jgi:hypothetical protein
MAMAGRWPGPAPEWPPLAIALVGSEWATRCCGVLEAINHLKTSSIAVISASKATSFPGMVLEPCATIGPTPWSSHVTTHPRPADILNEPSVQAWPVLRPCVAAVHGAGLLGWCGLLCNVSVSHEAAMREGLFKPGWDAMTAGVVFWRRGEETLLGAISGCFYDDYQEPFTSSLEGGRCGWGVRCLDRICIHRRADGAGHRSGDGYPELVNTFQELVLSFRHGFHSVGGGGHGHGLTVRANFLVIPFAVMIRDMVWFPQLRRSDVVFMSGKRWTARKGCGGTVLSESGNSSSLHRLVASTNLQKRGHDRKPKVILGTLTPHKTGLRTEYINV